MRNYKLPYIIRLLLIIVILLVGLYFNFKEEFKGQLIDKPTEYSIVFDSMNKKELIERDFMKGEMISVDYHLLSGKAKCSINRDNQLIYQGNWKDQDRFKIKVNETGTYVISLKVTHAKGKISIKTN